MPTIVIPKVRKETDVMMYVKLTDNGVTVDWTSLSEVVAFMYSNEQDCIAGQCETAIVAGDPSTLNVRYTTMAPQFLGVNSLLIRCTYDGMQKSFDVPVLEFVDRTAEATGQVTLDDPELPVSIEVTDVDTSLLDEAIAAALDAAAAAAAAAALVPLDVLTQCQEATIACQDATAHASPIIGENGNWKYYDPETEEYVDSELPSRGIQGPQGEQGAQGIQGNTGSSVAYPYELVNNRTTDDATKGLSAAEGKRLGDDLSQIDQKIGDTGFQVSRPNLTFSSGYINYSNGQKSNSSVNSCSDAVNVEGFETIEYLSNTTTSSASTAAAAFYDENGDHISSIAIEIASTQEEKIYTANVPTNAKTFRFTVRNDYLDDAYVVLKKGKSIAEILEEGVAAGAVTTVKLADGAVTKEKMAANMGGCFGLTKNLFNPNDPDFETGKYLKSNGTTATMSTAAISPFIPLTQEMGTLVASVNGVQMNYGGYGICVYDINKELITGWEEGTKGYAEWQANVAYARFTLTNYANGNIQIEQGTTPTAYVAYKFGLKGEALLPGSVNASAIAPGAVSSDKLAPDASFPATLPAISLCGLKGESVEEASVSDETITIADWPIYLKSSAIVSMEAQITSFGTIYVGVGPAYTRSRFVKIDATNLYFGHGDSTPDAIDKTVAHGLSIGTFIKAIVAIEGLKTTAIISTIDGVFKDECTRTDVSGNHESYGPPYLKADSSTALTDVKLNANSKQFQRPVWVFGDSMASEFTDRWPYYARYAWGFDFYLDALAGGKSSDLFPDLELALAHGTPKYLLWLLGVNDLIDNQSASYKTYVEQVEELCASHGIELILQRFPSFPEVDPTSINEWIAARGHRVVDFYRATGSDNAGNWYPGYMSNDNRHPSILGAKAEASQVCIDVPEIMQ